MTIPNLKTLFSKSTSSRVFYNTAAQFASRLLLLVIGLLSITLQTRYLGASGYGRLTVILTFVAFLYNLSDWGITTMITKEASREPEKLPALISSSLWGRTLLTVPLLLGSILLGALLYRHDFTIKLGIAILSTTLFSNLVITSLSSLFQVRLKNYLVSVAEVTSRVGNLILIIAVIWLHLGIFALVVASVLGNIAFAAVLWALAKRERFRFERRQVDLSRFYKLFWISVPLGLAYVVSSIYFKVDTIILSLLKPAHDVGIYAAAYKLLDIMLIFPVIFGTTIFPLLARNHENKEKFANIVAKAGRFLLFVGAPMAVGGVILSLPIALLIGGHAFTASSAPLKVLMVSGAISFFNTLLGLAIIAMDRHKDALYVNIASLVLNVSLNFALIPHFGYMAAAYNTLASEALIMLTYLYLLKRQIGVMVWPATLWRTLLAAGLMGVLVYTLNAAGWPVVISVLAGGSAYLVINILLRSFSMRELKELAGVK